MAAYRALGPPLLGPAPWRVRRPQLGLQRRDPLLRRGQFDVAVRCQTLQQPPVDQVLAAPVVDRLIADVQISGHVLDLPAGGQQIQYLPTELRRIRTTRHLCPLQSQVTRIHHPRLRETRDTPSLETPGRPGAMAVVAQPATPAELI